MKFYVLSENLQKKLPYVNHAVSAKSQLPVLLNVLLVAKNDKLSIDATDLEIGIHTEIPAHIEEEGAVCIPAKTFLELISSLNADKILFETSERNLLVKTAKTKNMFSVTSQDEFPTLYEEKGEMIATIKKELFHSDFSQVVLQPAKTWEDQHFQAY